MNIFKKLAHTFREWRGLRVCNTETEFLKYCRTLKTPEKIAYWIVSNIDYDGDELPLRWRTIADTLSKRDPRTGWQYGNCSEMACLACAGLRASGYQAEILCIFGEDKNRKKVGHALTCFSGAGVRGYIDGGICKTFLISTPWMEFILSSESVCDWMATITQWTDDTGKKILGGL